MTKQASGNEWCLDLPRRSANASGTLRSLNGAAAESLVIGRAIAAGFILSFNAWRDAKYDAVLDHKGRLYRLQIKYTGKGTQISVTNGVRSGKQINKGAPSRKKLVSTQDCDVLVGFHLGTGRCWVIPVEVIEILGKDVLSTSGLAAFEEAWWIFTNVEKYLSKYGTHRRLQKLTNNELNSIRNDLKLKGKPPVTHTFPGGTQLHFKPKTGRVLQIWQKLAEKPQNL